MARATQRSKVKDTLPSRLQYDFIDSLSPEQEEELFAKALSRLRGELVFGLGVLGILGPANQEAVNRLMNLGLGAAFAGAVRPPKTTSRERFDALMGEIISFAPALSAYTISLKAGYLLGTIAAGLQAHEDSGSKSQGRKPEAPELTALIDKLFETGVTTAPALKKIAKKKLHGLSLKRDRLCYGKENLAWETIKDHLKARRCKMRRNTGEK